MKITEFVKNNNMALFSFYRQGNMFYTVQNVFDMLYYQFPVPLDDLADATINRSEKALFLMRYIRKALEDGTLVKV